MRRLLAFFLLLAGASFASTEIVRDPKSWDFAPLQYGDIVVHGTIVSMRDSTISSSDFWMDRLGFERQMPIRLVDVSVTETWRGPNPGPVLTIFLWDQEAWSSFYIGWQYLICAKVHPKIRRYYGGSSYGSYLMADSARWKSRVTARGQRTFTDAELRAKVSEMSIERVAHEATLVFSGSVIDSDTSDFFCSDSSQAEQVTLHFKVEEIKKGSLEADSVSVFMLTRGLCLPSWRKHVPRGFAIGQDWLCFLQRGEHGWYPFAGANGMFQIVGDSLVYDDNVPFWYSRSTVEKLVTKQR
jgi:hypothetical protein